MVGLLRRLASALAGSPKTATGGRNLLPRLGTEVVTSSWSIAGLVDVETTGLNPAEDETVELALLLFAFEPALGQIMGVVDEYVGLREPARPIGSAASKVNGITWSMVQGKSLDENRVLAIIDRADFLVSHNADFDRAFLQRIFPTCISKPWLCSMLGIDWHLHGFKSKGLQNLLKDHRIPVDTNHRADADAEACLRLLSVDSVPKLTHFPP